MLTLKDVHFKIQDIINEYTDGIPTIDLHSLITELNTTEDEIMPHLNKLLDLGIVYFNTGPSVPAGLRFPIDVIGISDLT